MGVGGKCPISSTLQAISDTASSRVEPASVGRASLAIKRSQRARTVGETEDHAGQAR